MDLKAFFGFSRKSIIIVVVLLAMVFGMRLLRVEMSKLDEELVYDYYQKSINATRLFNAKALCDMMDAEYRAVDVSKTRRGEERIEMNRQQACKSTYESMGTMREMLKELRVEPEFKYTIESVTISPDSQQATVKLRASMRIGKKLSVTSSGTETLIRRFRGVRSLGSETRTKISTK